MGQKIITHTYDKEEQDVARWNLYFFMCKLFNNHDPGRLFSSVYLPPMIK